MIKKLLIILITLVFLITGCTHRLELSNLNVISSCIYDTDDEGNIILGIESKLPVSSDEDSVSGFKSTTLLSEGKTATEAWDNISNTFAPNLTTALIKVNLF